MIESGLPILYANQLGGQDELVFDGASFAIAADKSLAFQMSQFEETVAVTTWKRNGEGWVCVDGPMSKIPEKEEADYRACMLGLRDYVNKNGFKNVVLGLSGGIDSAICAALAVDALGEERVERGHDALSLHVEGFTEGRGGLRPRAGLPLRHRADLRAGRRIFACADATVRGHQGRDHRGKPAEPRARHDPDGDLATSSARWW